ncbi:MAG: LacI family DNA-binding transcriptional regulator [Acidobacteria bacterium]|nr:LacI family DNA-binding transcriptional regulator [Acidobacteriota bacterium]
MSTRSLQDVARRAGVSTATVSRVLNNIGVVKVSTRAKVLNAVEELKYFPNIHARALAGGASRTLGLVVSNLENPFFLDVFRALEGEARDKGYEVLIANTDYDPQRLVANVHLMLGRRVAGLALIVSEIAPHLLDELSERKVRTVVYDVGSPRPNILSIKTQYRRGMQRVVEYLHNMGHRKMAFVGHHYSLGPLSERHNAFLDAVRRLSPQVEFRTVASDDGYEGGREAVRDLFDTGMRPTAIICVNDFMAVGALRQLKELNLRVPEDVSVTGFDNIVLSEMITPSLTTVHIPCDALGRRIFAMLTDKGESQREHVIDPELVLRESTGPAAAAESPAAEKRHKKAVRG